MLGGEPALPTTARSCAERRSDRRALWLCLALFGAAGVIVRAVLAVIWPTIHRPDEVFQNLEPAHRLWTGLGVVSWEWREGIRSWLFPDVLYVIMRATSLLHLPAKAAVPLIWATLSVLACSVVVVGVVLGWRKFGLAGAVLCGVLSAFWPDLVYFGPKTLGEVQAGNLLVIAAGLASLDASPQRRAVWRSAAIGVLLGLAFDLRFQLAPALALVALWAAWADWRRGWLPLALGAAVPLLVLGTVDWLTWGSPFQSIWKNVLVNLLQRKADVYGVEPIYWYLFGIGRANGAATLALFVFFCLGARQAPLLAATSIVVIAFHSLIAHKEISFVYAALPTAIVTAGLGTAWFVQRLPYLLRAPARPSRLLAAAAAAWFAAALLTGVAEQPFAQSGPRAGLQSLWADLRARPDMCGLGLYGRGEFPWHVSPGYTGLDRAVPIYLMRSPQELAQAEPGFNYAIVTAEGSADLPGYDRLRCSWNFCLVHREQTCKLVPQHEISRALERSQE